METSDRNGENKFDKNQYQSSTTIQEDSSLADEKNEIQKMKKEKDVEYKKNAKNNENFKIKEQD